VTGSILEWCTTAAARVSGAKVVATNVDTNFSKEALSGSDGGYRILALPAGSYKLTVTRRRGSGFTETGIQVQVNDS